MTDGYFIFLQNIAGIIIRVVSGCLFLLTFFQTGKKVFAWCAFLFALLCSNTILLYMAEFLPGFAGFYNSRVESEPLVRSLLIMGYLVSYRMMICHIFGLPLKRAERICVALLFVLVPATWLFPMTPFYNFLYNTATWAYTFYTFGIGIRACGHCGYPEKTRKKLRFFLVVFLVLEIMAYLEVLIWINRGTFLLEDLVPHYGQRKLSTALIGVLQNVMGLWYGVYFLRKSLEKNVAPLIPEQSARAYAEQIKLTQRETEVLLLVLNQKRNQEIAELLHISLGTVKTHIHNIFIKAEVESREQLMKRAAG